MIEVLSYRTRELTGLYVASLWNVICHRRFLIGCFIIAALIRLSWIYFLNPQPVSDFRWYYERAIDFARGKGYSISSNSFWLENLPPPTLIKSDQYPVDGLPTAYWPVGYPAFLGFLFTIFGPSLFIAKLANVILYLGVLFLSYFLAKRIFVSELIGRLTLLILVFYPNHIAYSSLLASEILFLFLLLLGSTLLILSFDKLWLAGASGIVLGIACLVKPQAILIPLVFLVAVIIPNFNRKTFLNYIKSIVVGYFFLVLVIVPWSARNYMVFGHFIFISNNGGINLLVGHNPYTNGTYCCYTRTTTMLSDTVDEYERDVKARAMAVQYAFKEPWNVIRVWPNKIWHLYKRDREAISRNEQGLDSTVSNRGAFFFLKLVAQTYYVFVMILFLYFIMNLFHKQRSSLKKQPLSALGLCIVLYFTGISLLTFGYSRFHFPAMPWIVMYAAISLEQLLFNSEIKKLHFSKK